MVTWSGWALLEAIGRIVAGPEPPTAHGPGQPLVMGASSVCFSRLSSHPKQEHRVSSACPFVIPSRLENLLSSGEIFLSSSVPVSIFPFV